MIAWALALHLGIEPADRPLLTWSAPAECEDQARVDDRLAQLIPGEHAASLRGTAEVTRIEERYRLRVELVSATGSSVRELESDSCAVLLEAAVFVVAVAIDPAVATAVMDADDVEAPRVEPIVEPETPRVQPEAPGRPRERVVPDEPPDRVTVERTRRVGGAVRAGLAVGTAEVSSLDLAPSLWGAIRGKYWRAEIGARYVAGRAAPIGNGSKLGLDAIGGVVRGCGVAPAGPLEIPICAGLDLAGVRGRPRGLIGQHPQRALRVAVDLAVALAWPLTRRVALWVEAAGGFALLRPRFVAHGSPDWVHLGTPASFSALVGVELRFGGRAR